MIKSMLKKVLFLGCLSTASLIADNIGVVNFATCVAESKLGKSEQANFENLRKQLDSHMEGTEKELNDAASKLNDAEYMDGLSPEAEMELREKARALNEEMMRYQNQRYQTLSQMNMKVMQQINAQVALSAEVVAKEKNKTAIFTKDSCFYYDASLDLTNLVIAEMDKTYDQSQKKAS